MEECKRHPHARSLVKDLIVYKKFSVVDFLGFLLDELDYKLSDSKSFNELRSAIRSHFGAEVKGKQY